MQRKKGGPWRIVLERLLGLHDSLGGAMASRKTAPKAVLRDAEEAKVALDGGWEERAVLRPRPAASRRMRHPGLCATRDVGEQERDRADRQRRRGVHPLVLHDHVDWTEGNSLGSAGTRLARERRRCSHWVLHMLGAKVVLPNGGMGQLGGQSIEYPGYDLLGVMVGSEGTMGLATEAGIALPL
jgi:hypothetical protein